MAVKYIIMLLNIVIAIITIKTIQSYTILKNTKNIPFLKISANNIREIIVEIQTNDSNNNTTSVKKIPRQPPLSPMAIALLIFN